MFRPLQIGCTLLVAAAVVLPGCQRAPTAPSPTDPTRDVVPIENSGPVRITFAGANVEPGSTLSGCGAFVDGCRGRLRISLALAPPLDGPVLYVRVYLHSMRNGMACLIGTTGPFTLRANQRTDVEVTLDSSDTCATPETMATMDATVEGPVQVESRQAWAIRYVFAR
jgi:hypothetical protein